MLRVLFQTIKSAELSNVMIQESSSHRNSTLLKQIQLDSSNHNDILENDTFVGTKSTDNKNVQQTSKNMLSIMKNAKKSLNYHKSQPNISILHETNLDCKKDRRGFENKMIRRVSLDNIQTESSTKQLFNLFDFKLLQTRFKNKYIHLSAENMKSSACNVSSGDECNDDYILKTPLRDRTSMSPITKSTQRMSRSMQVS